MDKTKVDKIFNVAEKYFENSNHKNPLIYLIAKDDETFYSYHKIAPKSDGNALLERYVKDFFGNLKNTINESDLYDWNFESPENCILFKDFELQEINFFKGMPIFKKIDKSDFLTKQYQLRFFNIELYLNDTQSIHLHQYLSADYQTSWKLHLNFFEDMQKIEVTDNTNGFTINQDFDFISYVDKTNNQESFSIIQNRKWFEKLYGFIDQYKDAYNKVSTLQCLDLSVLGNGTEDCWRKCSSLIKYSHLKECMSALNAELSTNKQTISKDILIEKGIKYRMSNGQPILIPENARQLKAVIKILSDRIVDTHFLKRIGISDYIEEIKQ